ncbi:hypothetical protein V5735_22470 (plasmid) [Haladaptatus sp. SPP-AMP-3]|uniref:hypothetical protein n=1 Tax=Haladaptatus sp. SPP-AMP-3 TaxID=3121295 RepID=UPI003C30B660
MSTELEQRSVQESDSAERPRGYLVGSASNGIERELEHDDFDPIGTLTLIFVYFMILVSMWVFMYFVEFLGRGITVVG